MGGKINPRVLEGLFTNLSAGWFGWAVITPAFLGGTTGEIAVSILRAVLGGASCLLIANELSWEVKE